MTISELPYRDAVGMVVFNHNDDVFVGKRIDNRAEAWQMPQGGIDAGETPEEALFREMKEEIGTDKGEIIRASAEWLHYDLPEHLVPNLWGGKFRGQRQKWFAIRFLGNDSDINIDTDAPEFSAWKWVPLAKTPTLIVPFKRTLYEAIAAEFSDLSS